MKLRCGKTPTAVSDVRKHRQEDARKASTKRKEKSKGSKSSKAVVDCGVFVEGLSGEIRLPVNVKTVR